MTQQCPSLYHYYLWIWKKTFPSTLAHLPLPPPHLLFFTIAGQDDHLHATPTPRFVNTWPVWLQSVQGGLGGYCWLGEEEDSGVNQIFTVYWYTEGWAHFQPLWLAWWPNWQGRIHLSLPRSASPDRQTAEPMYLKTDIYKKHSSVIVTPELYLRGVIHTDETAKINFSTLKKALIFFKDVITHTQLPKHKNWGSAKENVWLTSVIDTSQSTSNMDILGNRRLCGKNGFGWNCGPEEDVWWKNRGKKYHGTVA